MLSILLHIVEIFFQICLSIFLSIFFGRFFEMICTKGRPRSSKMSDFLKEEKMSARIFLLTGISLLGVTVITNIFYKPMLGFYLSSFFFIYLGLDTFSPNLPKGRRITDNCWVTLYQIDDFIVTLNDHKILISGERLGGKPDHVVYKESSPKWLPPHESDLVSSGDYEYMLKAVLKFLEKNRSHGVIQVPGEHIGPYFTKEDMINKFAQKGWKIERFPDGSIKTSPPKRKNLPERIINLFSKSKKINDIVDDSL